MAKWKLSPAFENVSKTFGNMVFYNLEGETFARRRPPKRTKSTPAQDAVTGTFTVLGSYWKCLGGIIQESWNIHAQKKKRLRGYAAFTGANINRLRKGEPLELSKVTGESGLASFSARTGIVSGEIICEFTKYVQDTDKYVTFFRQKKVTDSCIPEITRIETQTGAMSPVFISGCEPGREYYIYGVVTDKAYSEAETVSAARSAECTSAQ